MDKNTFNSHIKNLTLFLFIVLSVMTLQGQEICNNGMDDDADGLIDGCDSDCGTLIFQESFENATNTGLIGPNCLGFEIGDHETWLIGTVAPFATDNSQGISGNWSTSGRIWYTNNTNACSASGGVPVAVNFPDGNVALYLNETPAGSYVEFTFPSGTFNASNKYFISIDVWNDAEPGDTGLQVDITSSIGGLLQSTQLQYDAVTASDGDFDLLQTEICGDTGAVTIRLTELTVMGASASPVIDNLRITESSCVFDPGSNGTTCFETTDTPTDLINFLAGSPDTGGSWSPTLASGTGVFDPSVDTAGIYTYSGSLCGGGSADVVVTIGGCPPQALDTDGDTIANQLDLDDDNDGILDRIEQGCDISPIFAQIARWDPNIGIPADVNSLNGNTGAAKVNRYEPSFVNTTYVDATVSNLSFGGGVTDESLDTVGNDVASHGYVWISGVDGATVADARTNNDYLEFSFTMRDDIDVVARFDNIIDVTTNIAGTYETTRGLNLSSEPRKPIYADWSYQIEISYDGFVTSQILQTSKTTTRIQDGTTFTDTNNDAGGGVNAFNEFDNYQDGAGPNNDVLLQADITYAIRIYLFGAENASDNVTLDNFNISINPCENFDFDGDGTPNNFDLDSDNDGCADLEEAGGNFTVADDGVTAIGTVEDGNGDLVTTNLGNMVGATLPGVPNLAGTGQSLANTQDGIDYCTDTDGDTIPDSVDLDDDNDGILDVVENFCDASASLLEITPDGGSFILSGSPTQTNAFQVGGGREFANTFDGNIATFGGTTSNTSPDAINGTVEYTYSSPQNDVTSLNFYNNGGSILTDGGSVGSIGLIEVLNSSNNVIYNQFSVSIPESTAGNPFQILFTDALDDVTTLRFTDFEGNPAGAIETIWREVSIFTCPNYIDDIDNDGIVNSLDLDSDGDGCPDAVEGGDAFVIGNLSDANGIGDLDGGNTGGTFTGTGSPVTTNLTGDYGSVADPVASNYVDAQGRVTITTATNTSPGTDATVTQTIGISQDGSQESCTDTDGDSIADVDDLDDDNDGILDTVECFIAAADECGVDNNLVFDPNFSTGVDNQLDIGSDYAPIGTNFSRYANNTPASNCTASANRSLLVDLRTSNQHFWRQTVNVIPNTIYTFTFWTRTQSATEADPIRAVLFDNTNTEFFNELINSITATYVEYTYTINVGATNTVRIELQGNDISTITNNNIYIDDIAFFTTVCGLDTDKDGIVNALDLDSDGDGCPDATEGDGTFAFGDVVDANGIGTLNAGNTGTDFNGTATTGVTTNLTGDYGSVLDPVASNYVDAQGRVTIATATNTSPGTDATITQAIGFSQDVSQENCMDTDEDGVPDIVDIDDDNDGILDTNECPPGAEDHFSFYTENLSVQSTTTGGVIEQDGVLINFTISHPLKTDVFAPGNFSGENRALEGLFNDPTIYTPIQNPDGTGIETVPRFREVGTYTINFSQPVTDVTIHFWSLGDGGFFGGLAPELDFDRNVTLISSRMLPGNGVDGTTNSLRQTDVDKIASNDLTNNIGGNGSVLVPGTYTSIEFVNDINEPWWSFIMSLTDTFECDPDRDGIINSLDLDSDGDGCADAIEGGDGFMSANITASNVPGGNIGTDYIGSASAVQTNLTGTYGGSLDPVADNYVNTQGQVTITSATNTSPGTDTAVDQTAGFSQDMTLNACVDSDNDQVANIDDVDDDNDGILDVDENACIVDSNITPTQLGAGSGNPQTFTAINTNTVIVENRSDNVVVNDAGTGYRLGTATATKDRFYSVTFSNPVTAVRLGFAFINNNIDGEEEINTFTINNSGSLNIQHSNTSTGVATTFVNGSLGAFVGGEGATTSGSLLIYSDATFTEITFKFDFVDFNPELGTNVDNPFGIILTDVCEVNIDVDNDGIINSLDLDSDGDGCPDAVEGDLDFEIGDLADATGTGLDVPNNNNNDLSIPSGYAGSTTESVITNLGTISDTNPGVSFGVPLSTLANTPNTQAIGGSQDVIDDTACCDIVPPTIAPN